MKVSNDQLRSLLHGIMPVALGCLREDLGVTGVTVSPEKGTPFYLPDAQGHSSDLMLNFDPVMGWFALLNRHWDRSKISHLNTLMAGLPDPAFRLVDVGANIGLFSRQMLASAGERISALVAYEPHPENFRLLEANLSAARNAELHHCALGVGDDTVPLFIDRDNTGNYSLCADAVASKRQSDSLQVAQRDVAQAFTRLLALDDLPLIYKSDTQGMDQHIACAIPDAFWARVKLAVFELWRLPGNGTDESRFADILHQFDYLAFEKSPSDQVTPADVIAYLRGDDRQYDDLYAWRAA